MNYFIDTEFIEGFKKPLFGKKRHFVDLISIAIKCEDGREYYAISNEFNPKDADQWVKDNVISKLPNKHANPFDPSISPRQKSEAALWKSNKQIAEDIINFCMPYATCINGESCCKFYDPLPEDLKESLSRSHELHMKVTTPEFYAYYADYDWVVFCSLFGRMIDLPKGFPMYCKDLKQTFDETANSFTTRQLSDMAYSIKMNHDVFEPANYSWSDYDKIDCLKKHLDYPKQENEHSALDDAKWNFELFKFLRRI